MPRVFLSTYFILFLFVHSAVLSQRVYKSTDNYFDLGYFDFIHKNYVSSINNFERFISEELSTENPRYDIVGIVYSYQANCYKKTGNYYQAIDSYHNSLYYTGISDDVSRLSLTFHHLGEMYYITGEYDKALDYYSKALRYFKKTKWYRYVIDSYIKMGDIYLLKKNYKDALKYMNLALEMEQTKNIEAPILIPVIYNKAAKINIKLKDFGEAVKNIKSALEFNRRAINFESYRIVEIADSYLLMGDVYNLINNYDSAITYFDSAMFIFKSINNPDKTALTYKKTGDVLHRERKYSLAMQSYQNGLELKSGNNLKLTGWNNPGIELLNPDLTVIELLNAKAGLLNDIFIETKDITNLQYSFETYLLAIEIFSKFRNRILSSETRFFLNSQIRQTYSKAIITAYELSEVKKNTEFAGKLIQLSEKSKFSLLTLQINDLSAKMHSGLNDSLLLAEKRLDECISILKRRIYLEKNNKNKVIGNVNSLKDSLFMLNRQYEKLIANIEKKYPVYHKTKYDNKTFDIESFRNGLEKQTAFVEYYLTNNILFTTILTGEYTEVIKTEIDSVFYYNIGEIIKMTVSSTYLNQSAFNVEAFIRTSRELYSKLIEPIENLIEDYPKLIIVPDSKLGYIPFDVLLTRPVNTYSSLNNLPYLLKSKAISYTYSATLYCQTGLRKRKRVKNSVLAVAPFVKKQAVSVNNKLLSELRASGIQSYALPGTEKEITGIGNHYNSRVLLNDEATKDEFLKQAPDYRILHIATHGIIDDENPAFSKLLFYNNKNDTVNDWALYEYELYNLQLNAELAVLSACNTGTGKLQEGEGVLSFARGFYYAGVPAIVMTQWGVDDAASAELMDGFYKYLKEGKEKDEALRMAKLDFLEQTKNPLKYNPYYWAGYIIVGDTTCLEVDENNNRYFLLSVSAGILLLFAGGFFISRFT